MAKPVNTVTRYTGPLLGTRNSMGGALAGLPLDIANMTECFMWFNDFTRARADIDATDWTTSAIGAGTAATAVISTDVQHGVLLLDGGSADDSGTQTEFTASTGGGEFCVPTTGKNFAFGVRFKKDVAAAGSIFIGLNETLGTTDLLVSTTGAVTNITNAVGFWMGKTSATLALIAKRSSGSGIGSAGVTTLTDDTYVEVAFRCDVATITSDTLNGKTMAYVRSSTTGLWSYVNHVDNIIPNAGICVAAAIANESVATTHRSLLSIDYMWFASQRY